MSWQMRLWDEATKNPFHIMNWIMPWDWLIGQTKHEYSLTREISLNAIDESTWYMQMMVGKHDARISGFLYTKYHSGLKACSLFLFVKFKLRK